MLKVWTSATGLILVGCVNYLAFELIECDRLVALRGAGFLCLPIGFLTIPILGVLFAVFLGRLIWTRARAR